MEVSVWEFHFLRLYNAQIYNELAENIVATFIKYNKNDNFRTA